MKNAPMMMPFACFELPLGVDGCCDLKNGCESWREWEKGTELEKADRGSKRDWVSVALAWCLGKGSFKFVSIFM